ncbi:NADH dehydrogenase [ubiquinone] 1 beta subcomplex subunit 1 [Megachile rotundata]|uniref:NADH dehydrogenase [ubiquinone] 1 beta subcomplex subunit 1 n=1 Tax=Megachile rotundata TaxID=143995 RepID=UPI003FD6333A
MTNLVKTYAQFIGALVVGYSVGWYFDRMETLRLTGYRDKSALFGRQLKPGEPPSWP